MTGRRASLPGADELFRSTAPLLPGAPAPAPAPAAPSPAPAAAPPSRAAGAAPAAAEPVAPTDDEADVPPAGDELGDYSRSAAPRRRPRPAGERRPSGREKHDEKITVYCSAEELLDIERARLALRGEHGLAVDRGRIVREAVAVVLAEFEAKGEQSILVRRLRSTR